MVSIRYVDPYTHPSEVKRWQNQGFTITEGTLAVEGQFTAEVIQLEDLFITDGETVTALQIEQPLTSAIARGGRSETLRAQFIEGHDESYSEGFQTLLRQKWLFRRSDNALRQRSGLRPDDSRRTQNRLSAG